MNVHAWTVPEADAAHVCAPAANVGVDVLAAVAAQLEEAARDDDLIIAARVFVTSCGALAQSTRVVGPMTYGGVPEKHERRVAAVS
jgi:hypothetical protein